MTGGMIRIERETLLRPIGKNLDQFAARQQGVDTKLDSLRYTMACSAGGEFGRKIIHDKTAGHLDLYDLPSTVELPRKGTACDRVAIQDALMSPQIARESWPTAARKVGGGGTGKDARLEQLARDQAGRLRLPEPDRHIDSLRHEITQRVADQQFKRKLGVQCEEGGQPRCKHQSRKPWIDIHPEPAADGMRGASCFGRCLLQSCQQRRHLRMEAA